MVYFHFTLSLRARQLQIGFLFPMVQSLDNLTMSSRFSLSSLLVYLLSILNIDSGEFMTFLQARFLLSYIRLNSAKSILNEPTPQIAIQTGAAQD